MAGSVRVLKEQFHSAPMDRKPLDTDGLTPEEVMRLRMGVNPALPPEEQPNPYEIGQALSQYGFSDSDVEQGMYPDSADIPLEFDPMQAHLDEEEARRKLKEGIDAPQSSRTPPPPRGPSPRRYDDPPNPFQKGSPLDVVWELLKSPVMPDLPKCRNPECNRLATGTDGQGYCMYCEDDLGNYDDVVIPENEDKPVSPPWGFTGASGYPGLVRPGPGDDETRKAFDAAWALMKQSPRQSTPTQTVPPQNIPQGAPQFQNTCPTCGGTGIVPQ